MNSVEELWSRLQTEGEQGEGFVRLRVSAAKACAVYAARHVSDRLEAIVFDLATASIPVGVEYPEARGLRLWASVLSPGRNGSTRIVLALTDKHFRDVFSALASDVLEAVCTAKTETETVECLVARVDRWQAFLRRFGASGLSKQQQTGLVGELLLIDRHLAATLGPHDAVSGWLGGRGAHHDFQFLEGSIEAKATTSASPRSIHISNIRQLEPPTGGHLFLYLAVLDEVRAGDFSLPELVASIAHRLSQFARDLFDDGLFSAGFLASQSELYSSTRYSVRKELFYLVDDRFPRLREASLPVGVEEVRYQVAVSACEGCRVSASEVFDHLCGRV